MQVLLLHPEDDFGGPWKSRRWDWIVDLGRAPRSFYEECGAALGCPVSSIYDFALEVEDARVWRELFAAGAGRVVDRFGIDWWDVVGLSLHPELQDLRLAARLAEKLGSDSMLTSTRPSPIAQGVSLRSGVPLEVLQSRPGARVRNRVTRYQTALRNLSFAQIRQIAHDKFDSHYRWRRRFAAVAAPSSQPAVLLPTAYSNVSKTVLNYARLMPDQEFLLVVARESGEVARVPKNVRTASLAAFADEASDRNELRQLEDAWERLERSLGENSEFDLPVRLGVVRQGWAFLRRGVSFRNAWNRVFEDFCIAGCLSADDSNPYTRIPLILAARRGVPAVACHHGALDFRMAFKVPEFSMYLAQGEMERDYLEHVCSVDPRRIRVGAASARAQMGNLWSHDAPWLVLFSEPYEADFGRTEEIYREILPRLCEVARHSGKTVVLKLHPFESRAQRERIVRASLTEADREFVRIVDQPLSTEILRQTWCALTMESTVACECASAGIPVFLLGWLKHAYSGYTAQYARFGVGRILDLPDDLLRIPVILGESLPPRDVGARLSQTMPAAALAEILVGPAAHVSGATTSILSAGAGHGSSAEHGSRIARKAGAL